MTESHSLCFAAVTGIVAVVVVNVRSFSHVTAFVTVCVAGIFFFTAAIISVRSRSSLAASIAVRVALASPDVRRVVCLIFIGVIVSYVAAIGIVAGCIAYICKLMRSVVIGIIVFVVVSYVVAALAVTVGIAVVAVAVADCASGVRAVSVAEAVSYVVTVEVTVA